MTLVVANFLPSQHGDDSVVSSDRMVSFKSLHLDDSNEVRIDPCLEVRNMCKRQEEGLSKFIP
jgi:hypothetical protein